MLLLAAVDSSYSMASAIVTSCWCNMWICWSCLLSLKKSMYLPYFVLCYYLWSVSVVSLRETLLPFLTWVVNYCSILLLATTKNLWIWYCMIFYYCLHTEYLLLLKQRFCMHCYLMSAFFVIFHLGMHMFVRFELCMTWYNYFQCFSQLIFIDTWYIVSLYLKLWVNVVILFYLDALYPHNRAHGCNGKKIMVVCIIKHTTEIINLLTDDCWL